MRTQPRTGIAVALTHDHARRGCSCPTWRGRPPIRIKEVGAALQCLLAAPRIDQLARIARIRHTTRGAAASQCSERGTVVRCLEVITAAQPAGRGVSVCNAHALHQRGLSLPPEPLMEHVVTETKKGRPYPLSIKFVIRLVPRTPACRWPSTQPHARCHLDRGCRTLSGLFGLVMKHELWWSHRTQHVVERKPHCAV